jgi:hypothetical protein
MDCFSSIFFLSLQDFYTIVLEVVARHRDDVLAQPQIKITTETEDTLVDSTFCGDIAIWEQETGMLYQVAVYGG